MTNLCAVCLVTPAENPTGGGGGGKVVSSSGQQELGARVLELQGGAFSPTSPEPQTNPGPRVKYKYKHRGLRSDAKTGFTVFPRERKVVEDHGEGHTGFPSSQDLKQA